MQLSRTKHDSESRLNEEQRIKDRKRNVIVLIQKYLLTCGFLDSCTKLQQESSINLDRFDAADNIDLYMCICEFEEYYEMKFGRPPKLVKKLEFKAGGLPKINQQEEKNSQRSTSQSVSQSSDKKQNLPPKLQKQGSQKNSKDKNTDKSTTDEQNNSNLNIEISGNAIGQKKQEEEKTDDFFDVRVLKALPDFSDVPEFQDLAQYLQRDILVENPNVKFTDIVGLDNAKRLLKEAVLLPLKYPHLFTGILEPWRGILLFGPPGTGKTMLAKAVATECKTTFFNISASSVVSKWRGESEKLIRVLFDLARHYQPSTIFLDEIDSIMGQRKGGDAEHEGSRRMKTELLIQLDGLMKNKERVFLLAASNLPWDLDVAMLRRLEKRIMVPLPSEDAREDMLKKYLPEDKCTNLDYKIYASQLNNYSGSDIKLLCKEAAMKPLRRLIKEIEESNYTLDYNTQNQKRNSKLPQQNQNQNFKDVVPGPVSNEDFVEALKVTKYSSFIKGESYVKWENEFGSQ